MGSDTSVKFLGFARYVAMEMSHGSNGDRPELVLEDAGLMHEVTTAFVCVCVCACVCAGTQSMEALHRSGN